MYTYNSATDDWTSQGFIGGRYGNVSGYYHNDLHGWHNTDQAWTGGIIFSARKNGNLIEAGFEAFTGKHLYSSTNGYYDQDPYDRSLNKADTYIKLNGFQYTAYKGGWLQHWIHDFRNIPRFFYRP